ncbi:hypothetical protein NP493_119g05009 [Ridgeia piscesae]|uniref:PPM-type phosphatase domain-containing protein n=1 Tax=Ridgeia piscesae TaxID=27915 RepID=A0AAD9UGS6_RIDPI|nr:hypothetical protein NP493_119g05009 [Ridgeia piscesae]
MALVHSAGPLWSRSRPALLRKVVRHCLFRTIITGGKGTKLEMFPQKLVLPENHGYVPTLSPREISMLLTTNEARFMNDGHWSSAVQGFESNQLASNYPIEDRRAVAQLTQTDGSLFSVIDGHGGMACAQAVTERLFYYVAASLLPYQHLEAYSHSLRTDLPIELLGWHKFNNAYRRDPVPPTYRNSLTKFVVESLSLSGLEDDVDLVANSIKSAFIGLDSDISSEAMPVAGVFDVDALDAAFSGACVCMAHVSGLDLHVANSGDSRAVIGQLNDKGQWVAKRMSVDQNVDNEAEVKRVVSSHPPAEARHVLKNSRLLGQLVPLRAFGDVRFKWSLQELKNLVNLLDTTYVHSIVPTNYYTPPYLIATPDVMHHRLTPADRFLVMATDGIWETMSNSRVVQLVGEYIEGKETHDHFKPTDSGTKLGEINSVLLKRKATLARKADDHNVSTHLIRHALGADHGKVSEMLTLPADIVRYYRDDMTIVVVYFDSEYIASHQ